MLLNVDWRGSPVRWLSGCSGRQQLYFLILRGDLWGWCFRWWSGRVKMKYMGSDRPATTFILYLWQINYYRFETYPSSSSASKLPKWYPQSYLGRQRLPPRFPPLHLSGGSCSSSSISKRSSSSTSWSATGSSYYWGFIFWDLHLRVKEWLVLTHRRLHASESTLLTVQCLSVVKHLPLLSEVVESAFAKASFEIHYWSINNY